jgi:hypothetical protein
VVASELRRDGIEMKDQELRFKATIDDVEGHGIKVNGVWEKEPDDVAGHGIRPSGMYGEDVEGHGLKVSGFENLPDDTEGHGYKWVEDAPQDDVIGQAFKIGGKFKFDLELEGDVQGHLQHLQGSQVTGTDEDGNTVKLVFDKIEGNDVEGHVFKIG